MDTQHAASLTLVREFLSYHGFLETLDSLDSDLIDRGLQDVDLEAKGSLSKQQVKERILRAFRAGDHGAFCALWDEHIPQSIRESDAIAARLVFYVQIYLAVFPVHPNSASAPEGSLVPLDESKQRFRQFLETTGADLSQTSEFLPFYALPFVPDPAKHPAFAELFTSGWVSDIEQRLDRFVDVTVRSACPPQLYLLQRAGGPPSRGATSSRRSSAANLREEVAAARERESAGKLNECLQIATNLFTALNKADRTNIPLLREAAAAIEQLGGTPPAIQEPSAVTGLSMSGSGDRAAVAAAMTRPVVASPGRSPTPLSRSAVSNLNMTSASSVSNGGAAPQSPSPLQSQSQAQAPSQSLDSMAAVGGARAMVPLDFGKVQEAVFGRGDERERALLLQALRWRITKSKPGAPRRAILTSYIEADLLLVNTKLAGFLLDAPETIREELLRLINSVVSEARGRAYLLGTDRVLDALITVLKRDPADSIARQNVLGVLQKLSLRRAPQSRMIEQGIVAWLVRTLRDYFNLSEYSLEYGAALLMNLSLRQAGKLVCEDEDIDILGTLNDLLENDNIQVRTYVNGVLYSVLSRPKIRDAAKALGMKTRLTTLIEVSDEQLAKQLEYILEQLQAEGDEMEEESGDYDDLEDDEDEDDEDDDEVDDFEDEEVETEALVAEQSEAHGEQLLCAEFLQEGAPPVPLASEEPPQSARSARSARSANSAAMRSSTSSRSSRSGRPPSGRRSTDQSFVREQHQDSPSPVPAKGTYTLDVQQTEVDDLGQSAIFSSRPKVPRTP